MTMPSVPNVEVEDPDWEEWDGLEGDEPEDDDEPETDEDGGWDDDDE
jgi:hypothetical protein